MTQEEKNLSIRAQKVLARIRQGYFYMPWHPKSPAVLEELEDAGLIMKCMRIVTVELCYVPSTGYKPYQCEIFEEPHENDRSESPLIPTS